MKEHNIIAKIFFVISEIRKKICIANTVKTEVL